MLLGRDFRYFVKHELVLRPKRARGAALKMVDDGERPDALTVLRREMAANRAILTPSASKPNDVIRLSRIHVADGIASFLFRRRDPDASSQIFEHADTFALREAERDLKEAPAVSAHLFVELQNRGEEHPKYRTIMEEVPGLGKS